jgi:hypothetical protein
MSQKKQKKKETDQRLYQWRGSDDHAGKKEEMKQITALDDPSKWPINIFR